MPTTEQPNLLFVFTDQQSATMMSCAGNVYLHTPAMDRLAATGVRFERTYCTNPMCTPSRFSLMTGRMPSTIDLRNNVANRPVPEEIKRQGLGWILRQAGYRTVYGGKVHLPNLSPEDLGFEYISADERDDLAQVCADFIDQAHNQPFCLVASFINPHDICHMAIRDFAETDLEKNLSRPDRIELRELDVALKLPQAVTEDEFWVHHCPPLPPNHEIQKDEPEAIGMMQARSPFKRRARERYDDERWRLHRWAYCRLTERVDSQIARVLDALSASDQAENTVVIFTSDHGDMDGAHRMEHKTAFYEEAARIPLIISGPGVSSPGAVDHRLVSNGLDLFPTLCDFAGAAIPGDLQGKSLRPLLEGKNMGDWRQVVPVESEIGRMVVADRFKYMMYDQGRNREQLMDLAEDPGEMANHIADPRHLNLLSQLRAQFARQFS